MITAVANAEIKKAGDPSIYLCECGCGNPTPIANRNYSRSGWIKGEPIRFINGHHLRGKSRSIETIEKIRTGMMGNQNTLEHRKETA